MLSSALVFRIKCAALRFRPYFDHREEIRRLLPVDARADIYDVAAQGYSFPGGHSGMSMALFCACALQLKKKRAYVSALFVVFCVGVSRFVLPLRMCLRDGASALPHRDTGNRDTAV